MIVSSFIFTGCCARSILCSRWWCYVPAQVVENDQVKILWDFNIYYDRIISARRPDFTIVEKSRNLVTLVDVAIPADKRILEKEQEIVTKYKDLRIELEHLWHKKTRIIPVVIGALGAISQHFHGFIKQLDLHGLNQYVLQKKAILGTATIFRKVLQLSSAGSHSS